MTIQHPIVARRRRGHGLLAFTGLVGASLTSAACAGDDSVSATTRAPVTLPAGGTRVAFATDGKLSGGMEGYAWVAAGSAATVEAPHPCNREGCFRDVDGALCTRGSLPALTCTSPGSWDCNYSENWGVMVGFNPAAEGVAWGSAAPQTVALRFGGGLGNYRLTAHVAGDPPEKAYCLEGYASGLPVEAGRLRSECWSGAGEPLPSFAVIDSLGLLLTSAKALVPFDFCVTDVTLDLPPEPGRALIGDHGKLSGSLSGYAWVAGSASTTIESPRPCDASGCFRGTGGKLCSKGTIPPLSCTSPASCDWSENWGAMIGMNPTADHGAWGAAATESITFSHSGGTGLWLLAHVAGDPSERQYCLTDYPSGTPVTPGMLRVDCWRDGGAALPSFAVVDSFALRVPSRTSEVAFDYCITGISAG